MDKTIFDLITRIFAWFCGIRYIKDEIVLDHGHHEITVEIDTLDTPQEVWVSTSDPGSLPICLGNVNYVGTQIIDGGFIIYADIYSTSLKINWYAKL